MHSLIEDALFSDKDNIITKSKFYYLQDILKLGLKELFTSNHNK